MIYIYSILFLLGVVFAKGLILIMIARILSLIISFLNFFAVLIVHVKDYQFLKVIDEYQFQNAKQVDINSHYDHRAFWNLTSSKGGIKFGHNIKLRDETLSSMFGRKKEEKSLIGLGWAMYYVTWLIDYKNWFKGGHCKVAYESKKINN